MISITVYLLGSLLIGAVSCLFGKKLYFPILMLSVFCTVAAGICSAFELSPAVGIAAILAGLIAALLARFLFKLGLFLLGGMMGGILGLFVISFLPPAAVPYRLVIVLILAVAAGICAVKWHAFFIMAATSFNGAFIIAVTLCFLCMEFQNLQNFIYADGMLTTMTNLNQYLNQSFAPEHRSIILIFTILLAAGGFIFQAKRNKEDSSR